MTTAWETDVILEEVRSLRPDRCRKDRLAELFGRLLFYDLIKCQWRWERSFLVGLEGLLTLTLELSFNNDIP